MPLTRAVLLDLASIDRGDIALDRLRLACPHWTFHRATAPGETTGRIAGAEVVVTNKVVLDRGLLASASDLRLVCVAATGTNNVDLGAARELGIAVTNVTGYATASVVQHVFAVMLAHMTRLLDYRQAVAAGAWARSEQFCLLDYPIRELAGRTLGIVGYGTLGRGVAEVASAFGMRVLIAGRPGGPPQPGRTPLLGLLAESDVVSLHIPLAENTRNLIGAAELARMRPDALLINTARGGIVDERALAHALRAGLIGGAAVDVLSVEPPREGNPLLAPDIPNLILTPHIAWASREARQRLIDEVAENITAFLEGRARNRLV
ncbi:MAG: 2-hydroxyacid dehydrogenase [Chromatiaceae bacterium]|jgi:glycerate dehydrogenase|nr:2-hydroxyacid dehydrogenase [Chromatiaceae bacterium]